MKLHDIVYLETHKKLRNPVWELIEWHDAHKEILGGPVMENMGTPWYAYQPLAEGVWKQDFAKRFPQFVEDVAELPFESILRITFLESYKIVPIHQDMSRDALEHEPCAYRAFLVNNESFYLSPCPTDLQDGKSKFYSDRVGGVLRSGEKIEYSREDLDNLPKFFPKCEYGRWWLMNNQNSMHGTVPSAKGSKKIIVSIWGKVDPQRHQQFVHGALNIYKPFTWDHQTA